MCGLGMGISWLEIPRNEHALWPVTKLGGVCIKLDHDWPSKRNFASFLPGLDIVIRMMGNVDIFTIPPKSLSAQSF